MSITINGSGDINATGNDIELQSTSTQDVTLAVGGGSVGVGVASPTATLDVNGTIKLDGNYPVGTGNVALGNAALDDGSLSGNQNVAIGSSALTANTSGTGNIGIGDSAGGSNTTGSSNTAVGNAALLFNTTASFNTSVGEVSGFNSTGGYNTFLGYGAGYHVSSGSKNTIVGMYNGNQGGLDIRTLSNRIVLSDGDGNPRIHTNDAGSMAVGTTDFTVANTTGVNLQLYSNGAYIDIGKTSSAGNNEGYINFLRNGSVIGSVTQASTSSVNYNTTSDYRLKENVVDLENATQRLIQLQPKRFEWITDADGAVWDGFLAHEVQAIVPEAITGEKDAVDADGNPEYQGIDQSKLVPLLTAALQEAVAKIETLETANADMLARIEALEAV